MNKKLFTTLCFVAIISSISLITGCSPKKIPTPPDLSNQANGDGTALEYQQGSSVFSEENLPLEGSLDDNSTMGTNQKYGFPEGFDPNTQSSEYKKKHGLCTPGMDPIYFHFDQAGISQEMLPVAEKNAFFLKSNPGINIVLEGNSDQRGTNEYNLALAERRAINVQQYLTNMGINPQRIRTVSYGEERPLFLGHDEESYQYNRRVDFVAE